VAIIYFRGCSYVEHSTTVLPSRCVFQTLTVTLYSFSTLNTLASRLNTPLLGTCSAPLFKTSPRFAHDCLLKAYWFDRGCEAWWHFLALFAYLLTYLFTVVKSWLTVAVVQSDDASLDDVQSVSSDADQRVYVAVFEVRSQVLGRCPHVLRLRSARRRRRSRLMPRPRSTTPSDRPRRTTWHTRTSGRADVTTYQLPFTWHYDG